MPISATLKHTTHQMATRSARPNLGESLLALHAPRPERLLESVLIPQGDRGPRRLLHVNSISRSGRIPLDHYCISLSSSLSVIRFYRPKADPPYPAAPSEISRHQPARSHVGLAQEVPSTGPSTSTPSGMWKHHSHYRQRQQQPGGAGCPTATGPP